jgi:hypothetical protein
MTGNLVVVVTHPSGRLAVYGPFASVEERARWAAAAVRASTFAEDAVMHPTRVTLPPSTSHGLMIGLSESETNGATR